MVITYYPFTRCPALLLSVVIDSFKSFAKPPAKLMAESSAEQQLKDDAEVLLENKAVQHLDDVVPQLSTHLTSKQRTLGNYTRPALGIAIFGLNRGQRLK